MSDSISPREFREAEGTADWRVVGDGARAYFTTGSFLAGASFVAAIAGLADAANHHPDVDLRYAGVAIRLISRDVGQFHTVYDSSLVIGRADMTLQTKSDPTEGLTFAIHPAADGQSATLTLSWDHREYRVALTAK